MQYGTKCGGKPRISDVGCMLKYLPDVKNIRLKYPTTTLIFKNGDKSVVKLQEGDSYDLKTAILWAYAKHHKKAKIKSDYKYYIGDCPFIESVPAIIGIQSIPAMIGIRT